MESLTLQWEGLSLRLEAQSLEACPGGYVLRGNRVILEHPFGLTRYYRHGWQSWSLADWVDLAQPPALLMPPERRPQADDPLYAMAKQHGGSAVGALQDPSGKVLLLGALELAGRVGANDQRLFGFYEGAGQDWWVAYGPQEEVFASYANQLALRFGQAPQHPAPRVWCSWYSYYTQIDQEAMLQALHGLQDLPFEVFQLDDGWQQDMGDWQANPKFPAGMAAMAAAIKATGRRAGLWLAPFIVRPSSKLFAQQPEWLLRDAQGNLVPAGYNWGDHFYALDTTHPQVQAWLRQTMQQVLDWGYDYLKLDFLYAAALPGQRHQPVQRELAYRQAIELVRQTVGPEAYLLLCGAPILASLGIANGLRIGPDVAPYFKDENRERYLHDPTGPSTWGALRTSLHRLWLGPLVHLDPDVAYFRSRYNLLSPVERRYLQDLTHICQFKATSDPPAWWDASERAAAQDWLNHNPPIEALGRYRFRIGEREVDFSEVL